MAGLCHLVKKLLSPGRQLSISPAAIVQVTHCPLVFMIHTQLQLYPSDSHGLQKLAMEAKATSGGKWRWLILQWLQVLQLQAQLPPLQQALPPLRLQPVSLQLHEQRRLLPPLTPPLQQLH